MESFYVVGDIESNDRAFDDAIECIKLSHEKMIVFLGDIYSSADSSKSVSHIAEILWRLQIPVQKCIDETFKATEHSTEEVFKFCNDIKSLFTTLFFYHRLDLYTITNKLKNGPGFAKLVQRELEPKEDNYVFILGNKECNLITDMHYLSETNIIDGRFVGNYKYIFQHKTYQSKVSFSLHELNVLITYLNLSSHFFIRNETLFTHIYVSGRYLMKIAKLPNIRRIVSGHNRCFGIYRDPANSKIEIFMMDVSHEKDSLIKNYILIQGDNIIFFTSDEIARSCINRCVFSAKKTFLSSPTNTTTIDFYWKHLEELQKEADTETD